MPQMPRSPTKWGDSGGKTAKKWAMAKKEDNEKEDLMKVWESNNPDACKICKRRVNSGENGLECELCECWFHIKCEKVKKEEYECIQEMGEGISWYCRGCKDKAKNTKKILQENQALKSENESLTEQNLELMKKLESLSRKVEDIEEAMEDRVTGEIRKIRAEIQVIIEAKVKEILDKEMNQFEKKVKDNLKNVEEIANIKLKESENQVKTMKRELDNMKKSVNQQDLTEVRKEKEKSDMQMKEIQAKFEELEREKRKKNIIVYNLKESENSEATERYKWDVAQCKRIFQQELSQENLKIENLIRLGQKNEARNRPLLVKLENEEEKKEILKKAKQLRQTEDFSSVYLARDMTRDEREREKKLREELHQRRLNESKELIIKRGKIVKKEEAEARSK